MLELDPTGSGTIDYFGFLSAVFLTQMYLKELTLYSVLQDTDTQKQGGVTIRQMKVILESHPDFQFPENALGSTFKEMLGADINQLDPECIIDTEKFIASLRKEFENIAQRTLSR